MFSNPVSGGTKSLYKGNKRHFVICFSLPCEYFKNRRSLIWVHSYHLFYQSHCISRHIFRNIFFNLPKHHCRMNHIQFLKADVVVPEHVEQDYTERVDVYFVAICSSAFLTRLDLLWCSESQSSDSSGQTTARCGATFFFP